MMKRAIAMLAVLAASILAQPAWVQAAPKKARSRQVNLQLAVSNLALLKQRAGEYQTTLPKAASLGMDEIIAYEEHKHFVCIVGKRQSPKMLRRMILLKPSTLVVDDRITGLDAGKPLHWQLLLRPPKTGNGMFDVGTGPAAAPVNVSYMIVRPGEVPMKTPAKGSGVIVDAVPAIADGATRVVSVIGVGGKQPPTVKSDSRDVPLVLDISSGGLSCKLVLPAGADRSPAIAITGAGGKKLLSERLLPSGILPHGPKGVKLLNGWDSRYRGKNRAPWDTGKVAIELKKVVEDGTIKPGRAIVLGCGTGTNSIYLASKGFDVTAVDIAPTALALAKAKALKAKVSVRWMLVDVTAVPELKAFDFIFDRGCYHGVRRANAKGFVASARKLSRAGTKFLILAGNANEARHYGPPRVKEKDIRKDFTSSFDFTWLKETKFGPDGEKGKGPLMWSILLTRKDK
ncbi:MAG: methyltransferase domain-containing protein [Phycisphaerae bacterium]|jgi:SAM-dependent methyltransferase|nr:methyltransferase domain-containing protein [Phycisphaerae bacterium]